ncbi:MAG: N-acetylmuramic acid 6-phosphate etherase, partial [Candidatus Marinimicrobia bacterium]|nr:N-acetylmuramic acid 6-phosphate etherase [Candidatus Neomarinimicrobiota bacterium]
MAISEHATEQQNVNSKFIDKMNTKEILKVMNSEDKTIPMAVEKAIPQIEEFTEKVIESFNNGGSLYYVGAGTSGRLGVLDASEIPPTFSASPKLVQGIIAGGLKALTTAVEGAEDYPEDGKQIIIDKKITKNDCVLGITTSGMASYVMGALEQAKEIGASTGLLVCNEFASREYIDTMIKVVVGPEIVTGSTRMKAGTATKLVINMITTTAMIRINKTYGNLMVDLMALNKKLWDRGARIVKHCTNIEYDRSLEILKRAEGKVKTALVMGSLDVSY